MVNGRIYLPGGRKCLIRALDSHRRHPALALLECKAHALALIELAQPGMLHGADMHKNIIAAGIGRNEAIALPGVEPFHDACKRWAGERIGFRTRLGFFYRFHFDTFLTGWNRTWVIAAGFNNRQLQDKRNGGETSIGKSVAAMQQISKSVSSVDLSAKSRRIRQIANPCRLREQKTQIALPENRVAVQAASSRRSRTRT
jgi:hypothetical protein